MDDTKAWYRSKTIWGALLAIFASLANIFGVEIAGAEQAALAEHVVALVAAAGGILAIIGRVGARRTLR